MVPEERKPLPGTRSVVAWQHSYIRLVIVAAASHAVSVALAVSAWRRAPFDLQAIKVPPEVVTCLAGAFAILALVKLFEGLRAGVRVARLRRCKIEHPEEPWLGDHEWSSRGAVDTCRPAAVRALAATVLVTILLAPLNVWALAARPADLTRLITVGAFDLVIPLCLARALVLLVRHWRLGVSRLAFRRFPFFTGSRVEVGLSSTRADFRAFEHIIFRLRLVEEAWDHPRKRRRVTRTQLYFDEMELSGDALARSWSSLHLSFRVPRTLPGTDLGADPVRYWELEAQGEAHRKHFRARFLVPVYAPPRQLLERLAALALPQAEPEPVTA